MRRGDPKARGGRVDTADARRTRPLIINRLENVSKDVFKKYYPQITDLVGSSPGIYALYDGSELYYVGRSNELRRRVKHHLLDRHLASWTHFSLYLARREDHIHEIESLLVRIANPKGNRVIPRGRSTGVLVHRLKAMIKERQKAELAELFQDKHAAGRVVHRRTVSEGAASLAGLVSKRTKLYRTYKEKEYTASLSPNGLVTFAGKRYKSPTAAAKAVVRRKSAINGRAFWYIRDASGQWVRLLDYKG
ncbi:MAG: hypothetical protein U1F64_10800 [Burkholderiales bacterium]